MFHHHALSFLKTEETPLMHVRKRAFRQVLTTSHCHCSLLGSIPFFCCFYIYSKSIIVLACALGSSSSSSWAFISPRRSRGEEGETCSPSGTDREQGSKRLLEIELINQPSRTSSASRPDGACRVQLCIQEGALRSDDGGGGVREEGGGQGGEAGNCGQGHRQRHGHHDGGEDGVLGT
jgi:hypothetical protein